MRQTVLAIMLFCVISCKQHAYRVPSGGMEGTIRVGETISVTETDKFERNDIVVFSYYGPDLTSPDDENGGYKLHWEKRVSRLIAYSGDSVEIKDGEVLVNGRRVALPPKAKVRYKVLSKGPVPEFTEEASYEVRLGKPVGDTTVNDVSLTTEQAFDYGQRNPFIISVRRILPDLQWSDTMYARALETGKWTSDNYGPFKIPSPGDHIVVDRNNFKFYGNIPGIKEGMNSITEKLFFVLGDNRYGAADSRFIGLIAHSKMYGVVKIR